jgi:hypothetical protein
MRAILVRQLPGIQLRAAVRTYLFKKQSGNPEFSVILKLSSGLPVGRQQ